MSIQRRLRMALNRVGLDLDRWPEGHPANERVKLMKSQGVDLVLDVGANDGGYARELRRYGYMEQIVSYEPLAEPRQRIDNRDARWQVEPYAVGSENGEIDIHVAANDEASSSVLDMLQTHKNAAPQANYRAVERAEMRTLDSMWPAGRTDGKVVFVKIDVQGYEGHVLDGAESLLGRVAGLQVELSLVPLYDGAPTWRSMVGRLGQAGFDVFRVDGGFRDTATGRMLQADGTFYRR